MLRAGSIRLVNQKGIPGPVFAEVNEERVEDSFI